MDGSNLPNGFRGFDSGKGNQIYHFSAGPDVRIKQHKRTFPMRTANRGLARTPLAQELSRNQMPMNDRPAIPNLAANTPFPNRSLQSPGSVRPSSTSQSITSSTVQSTVKLVSSVSSAVMGFFARATTNSARTLNKANVVEERPLSAFVEEPFGIFGVPDTLYGTNLPPAEYQRPNEASQRPLLRAKRLLPTTNNQPATPLRTMRLAENVSRSPGYDSFSSSNVLNITHPKQRFTDANGDISNRGSPRQNTEAGGVGRSTPVIGSLRQSAVVGSMSARRPASTTTLQLDDFEGSENEQPDDERGNTAERSNNNSMEEDIEEKFVTPSSSPAQSVQNFHASAAVDVNGGEASLQSMVTPRKSTHETRLRLNNSGGINRSNIRQGSKRDRPLDEEDERSIGDSGRRTVLNHAGRNNSFMPDNLNRALPSLSEQPLQFLSPVASLADYVRDRPASRNMIDDSAFTGGNGTSALEEYHLSKVPPFYVRRVAGQRKKIKREQASSGGSPNDTRSPSSMSYASSLFSSSRPPTFQTSSGAAFRADIIKSIHQNFRSPALQDIIITGVTHRGGNGSILDSKKENDGGLQYRYSGGHATSFAVPSGVAGQSSSRPTNTSFVVAPSNVSTTAAVAPLPAALQFLYVTEKQNDSPLDIDELLGHQLASPTGRIGVQNKFTGEIMQVNESILRSYVSYRQFSAGMKRIVPHFTVSRLSAVEAAAAADCAAITTLANDASVLQHCPTIRVSDASENASTSERIETATAARKPDNELTTQRPSVHQRLGARREEDDFVAGEVEGLGDISAATSDLQNKVNGFAQQHQKLQRSHAEPSSPSKQQYKNLFAKPPSPVSTVKSGPDFSLPLTMPITTMSASSAAGFKLGNISNTIQTVANPLPGDATPSLLFVPTTSFTTLSQASDSSEKHANGMPKAQQPVFGVPAIVTSASTEQPVAHTSGSVLDLVGNRRPEISSAANSITTTTAAGSGSGFGFNFPVMPQTTQSAVLPSSIFSPAVVAAPQSTPTSALGISNTAATTSAGSGAIFTWGGASSAATVPFGTGNPVAPLLVNGAGLAAGSKSAFGTTSTNNSTVVAPSLAGASFNFASPGGAFSSNNTTTTTISPQAAAKVTPFVFGQSFADQAAKSANSPVPNASGNALFNGLGGGGGAAASNIFRYANPAASGSAPNLVFGGGIGGAPVFGGSSAAASAFGMRPPQPQSSMFDFQGSSSLVPAASAVPAFGAPLSSSGSVAPFSFGQPSTAALLPTPQQQQQQTTGFGGGIFGGGGPIQPPGSPQRNIAVSGGILYGDAARRKLQARRSNSRSRR